jgi:hypothetical protein
VFGDEVSSRPVGRTHFAVDHFLLPLVSYGQNTAVSQNKEDKSAWLASGGDELQRRCDLRRPQSVRPQNGGSQRPPFIE